MSWELAGISAEAAWATFASFGAVVTALYFLRLRRRPIEVPFVHLWREVLADERSSQLFQRLTRLVSLLLALLLVALITLALADPRRSGHAGDGRVVVIALDTSASMQATDVAGGRLAAARREAMRVIDALGATDRAIVVAMGAEARPLSALGADAAALRDAIAHAEADDLVADLPAAARFAADLAHGSARAELVLVSDGALEGEAEARALLEAARVSARHVRVGASDASASPNLGITALAIRRYPLDTARNEVLLEVRSASDRDETVEVTLLGDGEVIDVERVSLAAGARERRFFQDLSGVDRGLEARIAVLGPGGEVDPARDVLAADDHAWALVPARRRARVALVSEDDIYLEAALLLDEYLDVETVAPSAWPPSEPFDVAILDRFVPSAPVDGDVIWIDPIPPEGAAGPLEVTGTIERPFFDRLRAGDPLLRHVALADVNVARALEVRPAPGDVVVGGDARGPLLVRGSRDGHRFAALTFDVRDSDLPLRPAFPLLLLNAIDSFAPSDAAYRGSVTTGEPAFVALPSGATRASIDGVRLPVRDGQAVVRFARAGQFALETDAGEVPIAANLAADRELALATRQLELGAPPPAALAAATDSFLGGVMAWQWLVLAALALLFVEWATFHRRWTV
jgi:hypothetical protein